MFLHGFEHCGLSLWWRAVDFIRKDYVGKDRPRNESNNAAARRMVFFDYSVPKMSEGIRSGVN